MQAGAVPRRQAVGEMELENLPKASPWRRRPAFGRTFRRDATWRANVERESARKGLQGPHTRRLTIMDPRQVVGGTRPGRTVLWRQDRSSAIPDLYGR